MKRRLLLLSVLVLISVFTFSGATLAGFSKQYNPRVDDLQFTVATQEYMMISKTGEPGSFEDNIAFADLIENEVTLNPLKGVIGENSITLYDESDVAVSNDNYIMFTLYFSGSEDMDIYLAGSTSGTVVDTIKIENSIFTEEQINKMVDSLRIGFLAYSTRETPTSSGVKVDYDPIETNIYSVNEKNNNSYKDNLLHYETFKNIGYTEGPDDVCLLSVAANKVGKMDIYIWLEGEDVNCDESIFNSLLQINMRFLAVKKESGGN